MALLSWARFLVASSPFERWRDKLGFAQELGGSGEDEGARMMARRLAAQVERAAERLPFPAKCLPRAMALSWLLRGKQIGHTVVIAVRPAYMRGEPDPLHAWVEIDGAKLVGDLPGPWLEIMRLGCADPMDDPPQVG